MLKKLKEKQPDFDPSPIIELFLHPPVTNDYSLAAGRPHAEVIRKMLCNSYDFSQEGVYKANERFKVKAGQMPFGIWVLVTREESVFRRPQISSPPSRATRNPINEPCFYKKIAMINKPSILLTMKIVALGHPLHAVQCLAGVILIQVVLHCTVMGYQVVLSVWMCRPADRIFPTITGEPGSSAGGGFSRRAPELQRIPAALFWLPNNTPVTGGIWLHHT